MHTLLQLPGRVATGLLDLHVLVLGLAVLALFVRGRLAWGVAILALVWALVPVATVVSIPLQSQPFPDAAEYADAANHLAHGDGYVTTVRDQPTVHQLEGGVPQPPKYPPGFSMVLAPFAAFGDYPANVELGTRVIAMVYIVATFAVAWGMAGPQAATFTAILVGSSPFAQLMGSVVLSDALAAAITAPLLLLMRSTTNGRALLAGGIAGVLTTIRLSSGLALPALLYAARGRQRLFVLVGAAPVLLALGIYQWLTFGSPLRTGYDYWLPGAKNFDLAMVTMSQAFGDGPWIVPDRLRGALMGWVCPCADGGPMATAPNVLLYPAVLLGLFWTFAPPLVALIGLAYMWHARREADVRFAAAFVVLSLGFYCVYFYQAARFMAAPATLLAIYTGVGTSYFSRYVTDPVRRFASSGYEGLNAVTTQRIPRGHRT